MGRSLLAAKSATMAKTLTRAKTIGSFSIDIGNGSENVRFKMNSLIFNICSVYSNLLKMASVGEFPWS